MASTAIHFSVADVDAPGRRVDRRIGDSSGDWSIFVLNGHGRRFWTRSAGAFSIKWMADGHARYDLERRPATVSREVAVLVDQDQPYEMEFDAKTGGESFCLFFSEALTAEAWASVEAGMEPVAGEGRLRSFPNAPFRPDKRLAGWLRDLHADGPQAGADMIEARLLLALGAAIETAHLHRRLAPRLPAAKASTTAHVLSLVERARGLIEDAGGVGVGLADLARAVGLSRFHLLRLFKAAYGITPLGFAEQVRMAAAKDRLVVGRQSIGEVAAGLGYESPSAFARAFRRHHQCAPAAVRRRAEN